MKRTKFLLASVLAFGALTMSAVEAKITPATVKVSDVKQAKNIVIKGSDAMQFDLKEIKVKVMKKFLVIINIPSNLSIRSPWLPFIHYLITH